MAKETELKLRCDTKNIPALSQLLDSIAKAQGSRQLNNAYFDTENTDLAKAKRPYEFVKTKGNTNRPLKPVVKVLPACSSEGSGIGLFLLTHLKWSGCSKKTYSSNYPVTYS